MRVRASIVVLGCLLALSAAPAAARAAEDGPTQSTLLDGGWLFRLDPSKLGLRHRWMRSRSTADWTPVTVPNAWNANDPSVASMIGGIGWYRKDFKLPSSSARLDWSVRFDSVNYRATVWLNGHGVGSNAGAYLPFDVLLSHLNRHGTNRLVVRVDSHRRRTDFPPSGVDAQGGPTGGWWNWSGILREVHLQRVDTIAFDEVQVLPVLRCVRCPATVRVRLQLANVTGAARRVSVSGSYGGHGFRLSGRTIAGERTGVLKGSFRIAHPDLWSPASPHLYPVRLTVRAGGRAVAGYQLHSGIRSIKVVAGRLVLNGHFLNFRGVGLHEDVAGKGAALDDADRLKLVTEAKAIGATVLRVHYPYSEEIHELADRLGLLIWSEIPVYQLKAASFSPSSVRRRALALLRRNIVTNGNHPSVMLWSIANELATRPPASQRAYIRDAVRLAHSLDPTRPVGLAVGGYRSSLCQAAAYRPLQVIGFNDYFGWYPGPSGQLFDRLGLPSYLDAVRACYRRQAIVISEFGAEANRDGPVEEKGTYAFQQAFVDYQLGVFATKPWLSGAIYWALTEFWVRPDWNGANPRPTPPVFQKGLVTQQFVRKPAWQNVHDSFTATVQLEGLD
jgi:beta-glucuronidase